MRNNYSFWSKHVPELWKTIQISFFIGLGLITVFRIYSFDFATKDTGNKDQVGKSTLHLSYACCGELLLKILLACCSRLIKYRKRSIIIGLVLYSLV